MLNEVCWIFQNPNISPTELQDRLQAFLGMHARYTVPGFAVVSWRIIIVFTYESCVVSNNLQALENIPSGYLLVIHYAEWHMVLQLQVEEKKFEF